MSQNDGKMLKFVFYLICLVFGSFSSSAAPRSFYCVLLYTFLSFLLHLFLFYVYSHRLYIC